MNLRSVTILLSLIVISLCLASSVAQEPFKPEQKANPLMFMYWFPMERINKFTNAPFTPKIVIHLPLQEDFCCDEKIIERFNKRPKDYFDRGYRAINIKADYVNQILLRESRLYEVMDANLKVITWVEMVNFFNKNFHFRELLLGDKPLVPINSTFEKWDYRIAAEEIHKYIFNVSLPENIPYLYPSECEGIFTAARLSLPAFYSVHLTTSCNESVTYLDCLKLRFTEVNDRFKRYEDIIDLVRKVLINGGRDRSHAHLFNPVARWYLPSSQNSTL